MKGQLWEECEKGGCRTEPVCSGCFYCKRHCNCGKPEHRKIDTSCAEPYRRGIGQGFGETEDG